MGKKTIRLRALEPKDIHFLYELENDKDLWHLSHTQQPFSKHLLKQYIEQADRDIYEAKQFRFAIEICATNELIGFVDLFDFDAKNKRAGIGIIIKNKDKRNKGYGNEAIEEILNYAFNILHLHQVYANISADNLASINVFKKNAFVLAGQKKEWNFNGKTFQDELLFQHILKTE